LNSTVAGDQVDILFWNDFGNRGGREEWYSAFANLGLVAGVDYDVYYTNGPSSGVGNGIGGRASIGQLNGYETMLYTSGDLSAYTITKQDYDDDAGNDVGVLGDWMDGGNKELFTTGDDLVTDLAQAGIPTQTFLASWLSVSIVNSALWTQISDVAPMVYAVSGNGVFETTTEWLAYGGCRGINSFDALGLEGDCVELAVFNDGSSGFPAATMNVATNGSKSIHLPYDFMFIYTPPNKDGAPAPYPSRVGVLTEVLKEFQEYPNSGFETGVDLPGMAFATKAYPNPFNPKTRIEFTMPKTGHLSLKVFNVRGELVKTLINEVKPAGTDYIMWDGTSDQGKRVSSGVYFYEARTQNEVKVNKMALVK
jgi:hypothetical protein